LFVLLLGTGIAALLLDRLRARAEALRAAREVAEREKLLERSARRMPARRD
jgi:hypothetical protein